MRVLGETLQRRCRAIGVGGDELANLVVSVARQALQHQSAAPGSGRGVLAPVAVSG